MGAGMGYLGFQEGIWGLGWGIAGGLEVFGVWRMLGGGFRGICGGQGGYLRVEMGGLGPGTGYLGAFRVRDGGFRVLRGDLGAGMGNLGL